MPLLEGLRVIFSKIHGYGVVATRRYEAGEVICFGDGILYPPDAQFNDTYALILDGDGCEYGETVFWDLTCQTRWFNHSCEPNTEISSRWDAEAKTMRAWWVATRTIEVGEEILYDYAFAAEVAEPCACGAPTCRGVIVDESPRELAKLPESLRRQLREPWASLVPRVA